MYCGGGGGDGKYWWELWPSDSCGGGDGFGVGGVIFINFMLDDGFCGVGSGGGVNIGCGVFCCGGKQPTKD